MKIAITGSIAYDYIMKYPGEFREMLLEDNLESISVSFLVDEMTKHRGGVAPNVAYTLALLNERPVIVGSAGRDFTEYQDFLHSVGVDTSGVVVHDDIFTSSFFVSTDKSNNQIASFYGNAMARSADLGLGEAGVADADLVMISPNAPEAMTRYINECKEMGLKFMYDPSQQVARMSGEDLAPGVDGAYIVIVNEYEFAALCQKTGLVQDDILNQAENLIITRGKNGADIYTQDSTYHIPIYDTMKINDPTGVGDAFRGGLLKGIASGWGWDISGKVGSLAAAYAIENVGPQDHTFTPKEFVERFRKAWNDEGQLDSMLE